MNVRAIAYLPNGPFTYLMQGFKEAFPNDRGILNKETFFSEPSVQWQLLHIFNREEMMPDAITI